MKIIDYKGATICVLEEGEMLDGCPMLSYAIFSDFGGWLAVKIWPGIAIPLHTDPLPTIEDALDEVIDVVDRKK
ncbi:hypothetical protein [Dickeya fangzhongdai]|uniref:Uncharacterized protein n=1 Tax=Dickeya fangzhongdai TaxID=1778540 RepID=A0A2K8QRD9_9GAMM|nr:hypothetical protein [Dickeya fangzhongdai]ATZ95280.1 hypothetical protein CVE23_15620 [Dickeya fangzhongdai]QOH48721.1 hypothetical protein DYD82_15685 [Dickeya fangzhongdai]QOH53025.1 hypothetical protein DYD83_15685 [Dickeya fangzhongdai]GGC04167.1 hypothetical protein GCM10007171_21510 [Dickeya fangzhongdai]